MRIVDNIYHSGSGNYGIDLGYRPTSHTWVRVVGQPTNDGNLWIGTGPEGGQPYGQWFRLFAYQHEWMTFDCPEDSNARIEVGKNDGYDEDYEFGIKWINNDPCAYLVNNTTSHSAPFQNLDPNSLTDLDGINNSTLKIWGDGYYLSTGFSRVREIWVYEDNVLTAHYLPAVDDSGVVEYAGMYDEIGQVFYGKCGDSPDIAWDELPLIRYVGPRNVILPESGASVSGTVFVMQNLSAETYHWGVKQLIDLGMGSAFTLTFNGQSGLTEISGKTDGTFVVEFDVEPWDGTDGSGGTYTKKFRQAVWHIDIYNDSDGSPAGFIGYLQSIRQLNPLYSGKPLHLGQIEIPKMCLGDTEIHKAALGETVVFEG